MGEPVSCSKCGGEIVAGAKKFRSKAGEVYCASCAESMTRPKAKSEESDGYALADDPAPARASAGADLVPCGGCGGGMVRSDIVCIKCGFNRVTGARGPSGGAGESERASKRKERSRPLTVRDDGQREARNAYIKSAVILAICLPIAVVIWSVMPGIEMPIWLALATFGVMYVATLVVYFICSLMWIGFDEPLKLEALRLAAACAITEIARAVLSPLPMNWRVQAVVQLIIGFVFVASVMQLMEMDKEDAIMFAVLTWVIRLVVGYAVIYQAVQNGWL